MPLGVSANALNRIFFFVLIIVKKGDQLYKCLPMFTHCQVLEEAWVKEKEKFIHIERIGLMHSQSD